MCCTVWLFVHFNACLKWKGNTFYANVRNQWLCIWEKWLVKRWIQTVVGKSHTTPTPTQPHHHPPLLAFTTSRLLEQSERIILNITGVSQTVLIFQFPRKWIKAVTLQAWSDPVGSRKFPDFMTTAQDGGKVVILTHRPTLPPGNTRGTHFC